MVSVYSMNHFVEKEREKKCQEAILKPLSFNYFHFGGTIQFEI